MNLASMKMMLVAAFMIFSLLALAQTPSQLSAEQKRAIAQHADNRSKSQKDHPECKMISENWAVRQKGSKPGTIVRDQELVRKGCLLGRGYVVE